MSTFEPGTVAVATVRGVPNVRVMRGDVQGRDSWVSMSMVGAYYWHSDNHLADVRPLVVLDPQASTVGALRLGADALQSGPSGRETEAGALRALADVIEAQTKPPRIPEPGRWGVVKVASGFEWVRHGATQDSSREWLCENGARADWSELVDPTLVRPGIEEAS